MQHKNFFMVSNHIFDLELKPRDFTVYCCLLRHIDSKDSSCFPSRRVIAKECGMDRKTFDSAIENLSSLGLVKKKRELQELAESIERMDMRDQCIQQFIRDVKQYIEKPKLTPELLRVFIRRIEVYEKFEKYSRTAGNPIRIHYAFRLPEQEGVPAIDVLAQPTAKTA